MKKITKETSDSKNTIKSIDRAIDILMCFTQEAPELSLSEICNKVNLPKTTVFRITNTLVNRNILELNKESGKYSLGNKLINLSGIKLNSMDLREIARPLLKKLRDKTGETANLYMLDGNRRICVEQAESNQLVKRFSSIGIELPLHCGSAGKVLLAFQPESKIEEVKEESGLKPWTEKSITDFEKLKEDLEKIREQGYAYSSSEREIGAASVSAPIRNHMGEVIASITISGPETRFTDDKIEQYIPLVLDASKEISKKLGYE